MEPEEPKTPTRASKPTASASLMPLISAQQTREPTLAKYAKNILTCLWFLPLWLFTLAMAKKCRMTWLTPGESRARMQIAAVVVSFMVAAALSLATEDMVKAIVRCRHAG
jgi:hypothetical protein